jgi:bacteriocin biosynthesis cyclodehydratase domain-containing protein
MAAAFPVTAAPVTDPASMPFAVVSIGPFGEQAARHLLRALPGALALARSDLLNAFATARRAVLLALWRPEPALCERADELAHHRGTVWLPVTMDPPVVRVGPLVVPGSGPCFRCFHRRRQQHDTQPAATAGLLAAYAADPEAGPAGYLPHHARLAAAIAAQMVSTGRGGRGEGWGESGPGMVTTIRLFSPAMTTTSVVGCHDCPRCGGPPGPAGELAAVLAGFRGAAWPAPQPEAAR